MCFRNKRVLSNSWQRSLFGGGVQDIFRDFNKYNAFTVFTYSFCTNTSFTYEVVTIRGYDRLSSDLSE